MHSQTTKQALAGAAVKRIKQAADDFESLGYYLQASRLRALAHDLSEAITNPKKAVMVHE